MSAPIRAKRCRNQLSRWGTRTLTPENREQIISKMSPASCAGMRSKTFTKYKKKHAEYNWSIIITARTARANTYNIVDEIKSETAHHFARACARVVVCGPNPLLSRSRTRVRVQPRARLTYKIGAKLGARPTLLPPAAAAAAARGNWCKIGL